MNVRRFLHVLAIMFSSLASLITHGHAQDVAKKGKKSVDSKVTKTHRRIMADAHDSPGQGGADDPPRKIDPALMASAEGPRTTMFRPMETIEFPARMPASNTTAYTYPQTAAPAASTERTRYPWRQKIVTTTFWVGEDASKRNPVPNNASSWDPAWQTSYGGFDDPNTSNRKDYIPASFTPRQNPFYVALPYNDQQKSGFKPEASQVIPWFSKDYKDPHTSVCKGRWIAIRFKDKVAYAQWEDCGPFRTDHWEYVFGNDRPKPNMNHGAGLDVSPAVRDFLGMNSTDVTDWRFVDFDEVPQGPWARLGDNNTFVINERAKTERLARARDESIEQKTY